MKIPKLPDDRVDWVTLYEQLSSQTMRADIEIEALERFVSDTQYPGFSAFEEPYPGGASVTTDEEAAAHASQVIILVMGAIRKGLSLDTVLKSYLGERKDRSNLFYPDKTTSKDPAWRITKDRLLGKCTWPEAIMKWKEEVCFAGDRTIKGWVAAIEPRVIDAFTVEEALTYAKKRAKK